MKVCLKALVVLVGVVLGASCTPSAQEIALGKTLIVPEGQGAKLTVYRGFTPPAGVAARVYVDEGFVGYVSHSAQNTFHVKPGERKVSIESEAYELVPAFPLRRQVPVTLREGKTTHMMIHSSGIIAPPYSYGGSALRILPDDQVKAAERKYQYRGD